jgi:hypothetical protein
MVQYSFEAKVAARQLRNQIKSDIALGKYNKNNITLNKNITVPNKLTTKFDKWFKAC